MSLNDDKPSREQVVYSGERMALCRCWQSKTFPYCDGSHRAYNQATGDQLGPVIVTPVEQG